jgi:hypothetical protein
MTSLHERVDIGAVAAFLPMQAGYGEEVILTIVEHGRGRGDLMVRNVRYLLSGFPFPNHSRSLSEKISD